jgi:hypothetical protein
VSGAGRIGGEGAEAGQEGGGQTEREVPSFQLGLADAAVDYGELNMPMMPYEANASIR